jgi:hypothetical protein
MHCILLNVTPMLFQLWNRSKLAIDEKGDRTRGADSSTMPSYFLGKEDMNTISSAMAAARTTVPLSLGHTPRRIDNHYRGFKAAEWKAWLLHYGPPLLWKHLPEQYLANFRILGTFFRKATQTTLAAHEVNDIATLAESFVKSFEESYFRDEDDRLPVCTINVHSILHFSDWIRDCGPACYFWQFPMERFCGILKPKARSKSQINKSIFNNIVLAEHLHHIQFSGPSFTELNVGTQDTEKYPQLLDKLRIRLTHHQLRQLCFYTQDPDIRSPMLFARLRLSKELTIGSHYSQRTLVCNRDDHRIAYISNGKRKFGVVQLFAAIRTKKWALVTQLTGEVIYPKEHIVAVQQEGPYEWIQINQVEAPIGIIQEGAGRFLMIVADINLLL